MASMSTPINQLPTNVSNEIIQQSVSQLEDPTIADVISEMEREVQSQPAPRPPQHMQPPPQMQQPSQQFQQPHPQMQQQYPQQYPPQQYPQQGQFQHQQQQQQQQQQQFMHMQQQYQRGRAGYFAQWVNISHAQRAILAAIVAAILFYPFETGAIYEKIPFFTNLHQYDRLVRTLVLAVVLYLLLLKLKI